VRELGNLLNVVNISSGYGEIQTLWDVSLQVGEGEVVAVLGPNGAGKTTLLKTIMGILKPYRGEIFFGSKRIDGQPIEKIVMEGVSLSLAEKELFPQMTVRENLMLGAFNKRARKKLEENLELVLDIFPRLRERQNQKAGTMSGGEQQMLAIGRALMADAKLLLLDEPSTGLAPIMVRAIYNGLKRLIELRQGFSILLVEQRVKDATEFAHRGYIIANGRIVFEGDIAGDVRSSEFMHRYLGV
jgi:branched-chain amino acid transport system ATP-binding protein